MFQVESGEDPPGTLHVPVQIFQADTKRQKEEPGGCGVHGKLAGPRRRQHGEIPELSHSSDWEVKAPFSGAQLAVVGGVLGSSPPALACQGTGGLEVSPAARALSVSASLGFWQVSL